MYVYDICIRSHIVLITTLSLLGALTAIISNYLPFFFINILLVITCNNAKIAFLRVIACTSFFILRFLMLYLNIYWKHLL